MSKTFAINRKARHDYTLLDEFSAGIVLAGHEAKSIRNGGAQLNGAYVTISRNNEAWLTNASIRKYAHAANVPQYDPAQPRKLLLKKNEIEKLTNARNNKQTIVPLKIYAAGPYIKLGLAIAKGKKLHDKRSTIKRRDIERQEMRKFK